MGRRPIDSADGYILRRPSILVVVLEVAVVIAVDVRRWWHCLIWLKKAGCILYTGSGSSSILCYLNIKQTVVRSTQIRSLYTTQHYPYRNQSGQLKQHESGEVKCKHGNIIYRLFCICVTQINIDILWYVYMNDALSIYIERPWIHVMGCVSIRLWITRRPQVRFRPDKVKAILARRYS